MDNGHDAERAARLQAELQSLATNRPNELEEQVAIYREQGYFVDVVLYPEIGPRVIVRAPSQW